MKYFKILFFFFCLVTTSFVLFSFRFNTKASSLGETYMFFERMQINKETGFVLLLTPSQDFTSGTDERILRINFSDTAGEWCQTDGAILPISGVETSQINIEGWEINTDLPGDLVAKCYRGDEETNDYIEITGIGGLTGGLGYGVSLDSSEDFKTGTTIGTNHVTIMLSEGSNSESVTINVNLLALDQVTVSAVVSGINTITCSISHNSRSFGTLTRDGTYKTTQHNLSTTSNLTKGLYWAVFGQGNGTEAGLWKSTSPTSLIPSTGSTTIDLGQNQGFGLSIASPRGTVPSNFSNPSSNIFGAINSGSSNSRIIFYDEQPFLEPLTLTVTLGARPGIASEVGSYSETLTYLCGGLY